MARVVRLSNQLVRSARAAARRKKITISSQMESWVQLGRSVEPLLTGREVFTLLTRRRSRRKNPHK